MLWNGASFDKDLCVILVGEWLVVKATAAAIDGCQGTGRKEAYYLSPSITRPPSRGRRRGTGLVSSS